METYCNSPKIRDIIAEDEWNDNYGKKRIIHKFKKKPHGITKADKNARKCITTLADAYNKHLELHGATIHSDRGSQYTSHDYRAAMKRHGSIQNMNSDGGRCHDSACCESMCIRMKEELLYGCYNTTKMPVGEVKSLIWCYYESYWNNHRICSAIGGLHPRVILENYYDYLQAITRINSL